MDVTRPPSAWFASLRVSVLLIGAGGIIGQLLLIRELMVVFSGNELSLAVGLTVWLLFEAAGAALGGRCAPRRVARHLLLAVVLLGYCVLVLGMSIVVRRVGAVMPGFVHGQLMGAGRMLLTSLIVAGPVALLHGSLFPLSVDAFEQAGFASPAENAYLIEIAGSIAGGLLFVFVLAPYATSLGIAFALLMVHLLVCPWPLALHPEARRCRRLLPAVTMLAVAAALGTYYHTFEALRQIPVALFWPGARLVQERHSPYGHIVVLEKDGQQTVFYDGTPIISLPHPDTASVRDYAWLAAAAHPAPRDVLVLGGALGGLLAHLLEHPVERLVYTEVDTALPGMLARMGDVTIARELDDPRTTLVPRDGRRYLGTTSNHFDLIMLGRIDLDTLKANRFFTEELFELARARMRPDALLTFTLPGSYTYLDGELAELNASLYHTVRGVFPHVLMVPGDANLFLASQVPIDFTHNSVANRLAERGLLDNSMFTPAFLAHRLAPTRMEAFTRILEETPARTNRDLSPVGFFYGLRYWTGRMTPERPPWVKRITSVRPAWFAGGALLVLLLVGLRLFSSSGVRTGQLVLTIGTSGVAAMSFDVFILLAFQSLFGHIYQLAGLFIASFMGGMGCGAWLIQRRSSKKPHLVQLLRLDAALMVMLLAFVPLAHLMRAGMPLVVAWPLVTLVYIVYAILAGAVIGAQFPLAIKLLPRKANAKTGTLAGHLYAADLIGGSIGGIGITLLLFPALGFTGTLACLALIKLVSLAGLVARNRSRLGSTLPFATASRVADTSPARRAPPGIGAV